MYADFNLNPGSKRNRHIRHDADTFRNAASPDKYADTHGGPKRDIHCCAADCHIYGNSPAFNYTHACIHAFVIAVRDAGIHADSGAVCHVFIHLHDGTDCYAFIHSHGYSEQDGYQHFYSHFFTHSNANRHAAADRDSHCHGYDRSKG
jgi:hypothetical protein